MSRAERAETEGPPDPLRSRCSTSRSTPVRHVTRHGPVIEERREANSRTRARTSVPDGKLRLDTSLLEPPEEDERAIYVSPGYVLPEILAEVSSRLAGR